MEYSEIAEKLRANRKVFLADITGKQVFMLLHDKLMKRVHCKGYVFEVIFTPVEEYEEMLLVVNSENCPKYNDAAKFFYYMIDSYKTHKPIYLSIDDEIFSIELDMIETKE